MYELKLVPFQAGSMELAYLDRVGLVGKTPRCGGEEGGRWEGRSCGSLHSAALRSR